MAEVICITVSLLVILLNMVGTILFTAGSIGRRTGMMRTGVVVIVFATITAALNLSCYLFIFHYSHSSSLSMDKFLKVNRRRRNVLIFDQCFAVSTQNVLSILA